MSVQPPCHAPFSLPYVFRAPLSSTGEILPQPQPRPASASIVILGCCPCESPQSSVPTSSSTILLALAVCGHVVVLIVLRLPISLVPALIRHIYVYTCLSYRPLRCSQILCKLCYSDSLARHGATPGTLSHVELRVFRVCGTAAWALESCMLVLRGGRVSSITWRSSRTFWSRVDAKAC